MVVFQFANDIRAGKKVCYTLSRCPHRLAAKDATLSRWISRVRIPLGAPTLECSNQPDVRSDGFVLFTVIKRKVLKAPALDKQLALLPLGTDLAKHLSGGRKHDRI